MYKPAHAFEGAMIQDKNGHMIQVEKRGNELYRVDNGKFIGEMNGNQILFRENSDKTILNNVNTNNIIIHTQTPQTNEQQTPQQPQYQAPQQTQQEAYDYLSLKKMAFDYEERGNYKSALDTMLKTQKLKLTPDQDAESLYILALYSSSNKQNDYAKLYFKEIIKKYPNTQWGKLSKTSLKQLTNTVISMKTLIIIKSLLTSLCQREEHTPLWKRGARGDFSIMMPYLCTP